MAEFRDPTPGDGATYGDYFSAIGNDILRLLRIIWRHKPVFAAIFLLSLCAGVYISIFSQNVFRAQAVLVLRSSTESPGLASMLSSRLGGGLSSLVGGVGDKTAQQIVQTLKSRRLIYAFAERYGLKRQFFPQLWDAQANSWRLLTPGFFSRTIRSINGRPPPKPQYGPSDEDVYDVIMRRLLVTESVTTGTITVSFDWYNAEQAATWTNGLVQMLNDARRRDTIQSSQRRVGYLRSQLDKTSSLETRTAITNLIQVEMESNVAAQSENDFTLRVIDPAFATDRRIWPKRGLIFVISALAGLVLGSLGALAWAQWRKSRVARRDSFARGQQY